jgi:endonuclease YncB( thermonuclease family)
MKYAPKSMPIRSCIFAAFVALFALSLSLLPTASTSNSRIPLASYEGFVIRVSDGDTIVVRTGDANIRIRLAEIDAPERGQPWGTRSKDELSQMVAGKSVSVFPQGSDRYGRTIAQVKIGDQDVGRMMIERGAAWAYRDFLRDPVPIGIEQRAKSQRLGLWAMPESERLAPWLYRAQQRQSASLVVGR